MKFLKITLLFVGILFIVSCNRDEDNNDSPKNLVADYNNDVAVKWNTLYEEVERYAAGYRPGPSPRALALMGFSAYEACISGMPDYNSLAYLYPTLSIPAADATVKYNWAEVTNASNAFLMKKLFANVTADLLAKVSSLESSNYALYLSKNDGTDIEKSRLYGEAVASAIWEWSKTDTYGHDAYLDPFGTYNWEEHYTKVGDWKPTVPGPTSPMFPNWGKVRTFAISESDKLCPAPLPYGTNANFAIYAQALEVYAQAGTSQSFEGKWIGEFWSDDLLGLTFSPGTRWIAIANQVYQLENSNLETCLECNAKVGMAASDAAVACWYSKYKYNVERPETYIQRVIDADFEPALDNPITGDQGFTPPFPAYPSGHSTMGAAGAEALSSVFGYNYGMTDLCHANRVEFVSTPRTFNSFYEMAEENAWSRVPLGVHFRMDSEAGVNLGYRCGRKVVALPWKK